MAIFSEMPQEVDIPRFIVDALAEMHWQKFRCEERVAQNIWRILCRLEAQEFQFENLPARNHIGGTGVKYVRKREAAVITHEVLHKVFEVSDFQNIITSVLSPVLYNASSSLTVPIDASATEKGQQFFKQLYTTLQKSLK